MLYSPAFFLLSGVRGRPQPGAAPGPGVRTRVTDEGNYYSVDQMPKILKRTPGCIRQMLRAGELEGVPPEETEGRGWKIPAHAVHDRDRPARVERPERPTESPERLEDLESEVRPALRTRAFSRSPGAYGEDGEHLARATGAGEGSRRQRARTRRATAIRPRGSASSVVA